ncbi:carboxymuconolactone decarboxylase family protein [Streptomyces sp. NBC_01754]|uniref:carboxymuconolactone decarboxylase family protein n=1 Tax=Streptomyces sp. NBC_01754 TaxID=2975930 RepID=UPI002DDC5EE3|nr:carboxymuconolactone decarboxylase family protein [Streptomyces sp. NBC_01754]WSC90949.1 carboxymuconolactone decarboxylase family protein [Streptomyces sp. NBC_01754]WSC96557.1 carboxymuconolactone decarboxylase family protein [Streptomyces sp. NBC_01754]
MRPVVRAVLRGSLKDVRYVRAVAPRDAGEPVARVYAQIERDFGVLAPPLALHSPAPRVLAASWLLLREILLVEGRADRAAKEVVATEVSRANSCPYCVDVHRATLRDLPGLPEGGSRALGAWARSSGLRPTPEQPSPRPPFGPSAAPELYGVAVTFHYINRMVSIYLADSPVPDQAPVFLRGTILRTATRAMRPAGPGPLRPGASLDLLPGAPLPAGLEWAAPNATVAAALGRAAGAVERAAHWVPGGVRECLEARLALWDGHPTGLGRAWLDEALDGLPAPERPVARLALLTAFACHQITDADVRALRERHPTDRELIELTSWAALSTALVLGRRFALPASA